MPHITKATGACENMATMFELDYFGRKAYLSQTGQLYLEALVPSLEKVWCVIHSFRAEPDVDERHLTEFTLVEFEFLGNLERLLEHIENTIASMVSEVKLRCSDSLDMLGIDDDAFEKAKPPYVRLTYTKAVELLGDLGVKWGDDLKSWHEKELVRMLGDRPVLVTHYPKAIKFFNMRQNDYDPYIVNSVDLLLPHSGEAVGGAEREHEYERLRQRLMESTMLKQLLEKGGDVSDFDWYLEVYRNQGGKLHSGAGIGLNRVTQFVLSVDDIRASTLYPMNKEMVY